MSSYKIIIFFYLYQIFKIVSYYILYIMYYIVLHMYYILHSKNLFVVVYKQTNLQIISVLKLKMIE